jgi:hypothetical protein
MLRSKKDIQIDNYLASCTEDELIQVRDMIAAERELQAKFLGTIIRGANPRTCPEVRAYFAAKLPPIEGKQASAPLPDSPEDKIEKARKKFERQASIIRSTLSATPKDEIDAALAKVLLRQPEHAILELKKRDIEPLEVPTIRFQVVSLLLNPE